MRLVLEVVVVVTVAPSESLGTTLVVSIPEGTLAGVTVETFGTTLVQEARSLIVHEVSGGGSETSIGGIVAHWGTPL